MLVRRSAVTFILLQAARCTSPPRVARRFTDQTYCSPTTAAARRTPPPQPFPETKMPKKKAAPAKEETTDKKTKTGPTPAEKLADELDDLMIAYLKACRETPDKASGLEKKMKAKTAQLAALQDQGIDAHPSWADVE